MSFELVTMVALSLGAGLGDAEPKSTVESAIQRVDQSRGFTWQTDTTVKIPSGFDFGPARPTRGAWDGDAFLMVTTTALDSEVTFVRAHGQAAVLLGDQWMSMNQAVERSGRGSFGLPRLSPELITHFRLPTQEFADLLGKATGHRLENGAVVADLSEEAIRELLLKGIPRFGRQPPTIRGAKGSIAFVLADEQLSRVTLDLAGSLELSSNSISLDRIVTTNFRDVGSARVDIPLEAREIVTALAARRDPNVYVPEPGFKRLFNGRDLEGWAGRPEHWTVEDGALTGRTTADNPARGNNFLIARKGDENLVVDDFELRLSYRIVADNTAGFANSGIQYRSLAKDNYTVAGYQADFEAGPMFSGILYDEAGGAGGRQIMAMRGEKVRWTPDSKKVVVGRLDKPEAIQAAIKPNDWNEYRIIARGNHLQHFINGMQCVDVVDQCDARRLASGLLALQLHQGLPMTVQFKDIRIRSLSSAEAVGGGNLVVAKDFRLDLLYSVPAETEGSWVALCVDPRGRLIAGDQNGKLYRLTPPPPGETGTIEPEPIALDIGGAHGLLYAFDSLYVMVNERERRGLYRLRDTNGDDQFDQVELLRELAGSGEHGVHSMVVSPDGKSMFVVCGNSTELTRVDSSRLPKTWGEDTLIPRIRTGFMDDSLAPQGWIARTDPDGKNWELFAAGLRNPFDIAFDRDGELFTYDADMEWDIGASWYRPTRINHVISGAEFGFRNGSGKWPAHFLDSFGAVVDVGPGSPTGITFGYGAKFPARFQRALFISDWSFGKLRAVHLSPQGSTYTGQVEEFVSGQPLPITDLVVNPHDGALYFAVGGRGVQSALYRVSYEGSEPTTAISASASPSAVEDSELQAQRDLRHRLEAFHGRPDARAVAEVWRYLGDSDRAIRYAARIALEWQDPAGWRDKALSEKDPRIAIAALMALARASGRDTLHRDPSVSADQQLQDRILSALESVDWSQLAEPDRLDLVRAVSLALIRFDAPAEAVRARLIARFATRFPTSSRDLNLQLAGLLVYLEAPDAAEKVMGAFRQALTQEEQMEYALVLRTLRTGWTQELREEYFRWFVTTGAGYRGGNTFASSLRTIRQEAESTLSPSEKESLAGILAAVPTQKSPQELLAARPFIRQWTLAETVPLVERGLAAGGRNFEQGRQLYGAVACASCHRFAEEGGSTGPDLTAVAGRFNVKDMLEAIVEPDKVISDQYAAIAITTHSGRVVVGRVANLGGDTLNLVENMFDPGRLTTIRRQDIDTMQLSKTSMMPAGLLNTLTEEQVQDLLAYLLSRGDRNHAMFQSPASP